MKTEEPSEDNKAAQLEEKLRSLIASGVLPEQDVADAISRWVFASMMRGHNDAAAQPPPLIEAGILAAVAQAFSEAADAGAGMGPQIRTTIRIQAAMRIVALLFDEGWDGGLAERIAQIWNTANAWEGPDA